MRSGPYNTYMNEGFSKIPHQDSTTESDLARKAYEEADPTTYSTLNPVGQVNEIGTVNSIDPDKHNRMIEHEGDVFYQLHDVPTLQQAVARALKGIINVSDIVSREVEGGTAYYSRHLPLDRVQEEIVKEDARADAELLRLIFDDHDHLFVTEPTTSTDNVADLRPQNIRYEGGRANYFDFNLAILSEFDPPGLRGNLPHESITRLKEKVNALADRFSGDEGREFARSIYTSIPEENRTGFRIPEHFDTFYEILMRRIRSAQQEISDHYLTHSVKRKAA